jgi:hypothetical protein
LNTETSVFVIWNFYSFSTPNKLAIFTAKPLNSVDYLLGKPTRANRNNTIKTKVPVSERMVAPEAA